MSFWGRRVLWIPNNVREMHARLIVGAHMQETGHRGIDARLERLGTSLRVYCYCGGGYTGVCAVTSARL